MSNNTFNQPFPVDQSVYPYNHVTQTRAGHIFEVDDTLGNERIHEKHKTGTFREIRPDGSKVTVIVSDRHTTVCGNDFVTITGNANVTINGSANLTVNGNYNLEVNGSMNTTVKGEYKLKVGAAYKNEVGGDKAENIVGKKDSIVGNGVSNTVRAGGVTSMVIGSIEETVLGGYTGIYTGSCDITGALGVSLSAPAGAATIGGLSASVDSATVLNLTSLAATNMTSTYTNISTALVTILVGSLVATGDVRSLAGTRGLNTHMHAAGGYMSGLTTIPLVG